MPQHYTTRIFCRRLLLIFVGPFLAAGWFFCEYWTVLSQTIQSNFLPVAFRSLPIPIPERLLITEVLYDPVGAEPGCEWVEIYNAEDHKIQLGGYKIGDAPSP
ncbi:MAG TPA: lamin tail domain-containing protein, partial [Anaerolineales bacterium]